MNIEDKAKKTLLDIGHQDRQKDDKVNHLREYLLKKQNEEKEGTLPKASMNFKLPAIKIPRKLESKSARRHCENVNKTLVPTKI